MTGPRRTYRLDERARSLADNRERILASARALFMAQPFEAVTLNAIAADAGLTRQTVLNHFDSKDGVFLAAAATVTGRRQQAVVGDLDSALDELVAEYEEVGDTLLRLFAVEERFAAVHEMLERGRRGHRAWVETTFAAHLPDADAADADAPADAPADARTTAVLALVAATDLYVWRLLDRDLGLPREQVRAVIGRLVDGVLATLGHLDGEEDH
jgi:AcrR family transcriptional regulator